MDITRNQGKKKKEDVDISQTSSVAKRTEKSKRSFDEYKDPATQRWLSSHHEWSIKRYGRLSAETYEKIVSHKEGLRKANPSLSHQSAFDLAWEHITRKKLPKYEV